MAYELVHSYAWIFIVQYHDPVFNVQVYHRAAARDPYVGVARGLSIHDIDGLRRFCTMLGVNGKQELIMTRIPNFIMTEFTVDEFMTELGGMGNHIQGSESLIVLGVTLEETRERLNQWSQDTNTRWVDLVELERAKLFIEIYCKAFSDQFNKAGIAADDIFRIQIEARFGGYSSEEILQRAIDALARENVIRVVNENGGSIIRPGGMWHILA
jgi:hypothetical protein